MIPDVSRVDNQRIIIGITYVIVFILGLYIGRGSSINITQYFIGSDPTLTGSGKNGLANITDKRSFLYLGKKYGTDKVISHQYDVMYEKYIRKYAGTNVSITEIGLGCEKGSSIGASAALWRDYLGPQANIHFIEFNRACGEAWYKKNGKRLNVTMHYGNQEDVAFFNTFKEQKDYFDIIVDTGVHSMKQQIDSLTYLLAKVRSGGVYIIENLQSSYVKGPNSGYRVPTTTIEFIKTLVDDVQVDSPQKVTKLNEILFSFEISNDICIFTRQ